MPEENNITQWVDVNYIQQHYLPISKKAIRKMLKRDAVGVGEGRREYHLGDGEIALILDANALF